MGQIIDVSGPTFQEAVLERSLETPVLIDFYAQWCGPCQMLKPLLEKLIQEYDGVLAKVDIDRDPELARIYQVEGVPDVRIAQQGTVQPGFVGMLPESQLRELLSSLGLKSSYEQALETIATAAATGDTATVQRQYETLLAQYGDRPELRLQAARFYLSQDNLAAAEVALAGIEAHQRPYGDQAAALRSLMQLRQVVETLSPENEMDEQYLAAAKAAVTADYATAMAQFLALVQRDRAYRQDAGRQGLLMLFQLLGDEHPLTRDYRKRLMQALY